MDRPCWPFKQLIKLRYSLVVELAIGMTVPVIWSRSDRNTAGTKASADVNMYITRIVRLVLGWAVWCFILLRVCVFHVNFVFPIQYAACQRVCRFEWTQQRRCINKQLSSRYLPYIWRRQLRLNVQRSTVVCVGNCMRRLADDCDGNHASCLLSFHAMCCSTCLWPAVHGFSRFSDWNLCGCSQSQIFLTIKPHTCLTLVHISL